jgi:large subunit ribosomal protein L15
MALRVLGFGELNGVSLTVQAQHFSESARQKIEAAGGTAEIVEWYANPQSES